MMQDFVLAKKRKRLSYLLKLYEMQDGRSGFPDVDADVVWKAANLPDVEGQAAVDYLEGEGLIERVSNDSEVILTHDGVKQAEAAILGEATQRFPLSVVQHFHGSVGAVQNGNQPKADVNQ